MKKTVLLLAAMASCGPPRDQADTTFALPFDTLAAAVGQTSGMTQTDSAAGQPAAAIKATTKSTASAKRPLPMRDSVIKPDLSDPRRTLGRPDSAKKPLTSEDSVRLRDSVIRFDLKDPRRTLGRPDSTKRPPL
jgi:hypothetical protein